MLRTRTGPKDAALRKARVCYNHLAGDMGVHLYDSLIARNQLMEDGEDITLTGEGEQFALDIGVDLVSIANGRRPLCKSCLDWSSRRSHLAGALGTALLQRFYDLGWATRLEGSRVVAFTAAGERNFHQTFAS